MSFLMRGVFALAGFLAIAPAVQAFDPASSLIAGQGTVHAAFAPWDNVEGLII